MGFLIDPYRFGVVPPPPTPASAVEVWWANDILQSNGSAVSSWIGRINGNDAAQSTSLNRPTFSSSGVSSRPAVDFDGTNDSLITNTLTNATSGCVVMVFRPDAVNSDRVIWSSSSTSTTTRRLFGGIRPTGVVRMQQRNDDTDMLLTGNTALSAGAAVVVEWSTDGSVHTMRVNNSTQTITVGAGSNDGDWFGDTSSRNNFVIGALITTSSGFFFDGAIAYLGVFDAPLSSGDRTDLYAWISAIYGV